MSVIRIGTSGWSYDQWNTVLYEPSLAPRDRLRQYTQKFDTVELNASFYRWPQQQTFRGWRHRLPPGFRMCVKALLLVQLRPDQERDDDLLDYFLRGLRTEAAR